MSIYQRNFLVPYLRDVYALQLALHKLQEQLDTLEQQKRSLERGFHIGAHPTEPMFEAANGGVLLGCGVYVFFISFVMFLTQLPLLGWFCLISGLMATIVGAIRYVKVSRENTQKENRYNQSLELYQQMKLKKDENRESIPQIADEIRRCQREIELVHETLQKVYSVNIIPECYQNIDAARFLDAWFDNGSPNDLETAFQVFSLVEPNAKLDHTVTGQQESILNRYLQETERSDDLTAAPEQFPGSSEDHAIYHAMIESNTATTRYFANAKYLMELSGH